jgi:membrane-associated HD superfamily phosphohydrolase
VFWLPQAPQYRLALVAAAIAIILAMVFYVRLFENSSTNNPQLAMNKISESTITAATEDVNEYDESMLIEAIDQPVQINIASNQEQLQVNNEITDYLIENDITIDDIAEEI